MTKQEKEDKIADLKKKAANKSLPASAVKKLEGMIAKLESEEVTEEAKPAPAEPKVEKKAKDKKAKKERAKDDTVWVVFGSNGSPDSMQINEEKAKAYISRRPLKGKGMTYKEMEEKAAKKLFAKKAKVPEIVGRLTLIEGQEYKYASKYEEFIVKYVGRKGNIFEFTFEDEFEYHLTKEEVVFYITYKDEFDERLYEPIEVKGKWDYDCDELIEKEKARKASAKKSAKKADATPTAKKDEKAAEKLGERVKKHYKEGELSKAEIKKIIQELQEQIKELQKLYKTAK